MGRVRVELENGDEIAALTPTHFVIARSTALICHCEERPLIPSSSRDVAISMGLSTCRRTAVATARGLPRYARNDKLGTHEKVDEIAALLRYWL